MNPYEADPEKIPISDQYITEPFYGRYHPQPDDFKPDTSYIQSYTSASLRYWGTVLTKCDETNRLYKNEWGGRDVFALGTMIIKSNHLHDPKGEGEADHDYSFVDANEKAAIKLVRAKIPNLRVPDIYFAGKVNNHHILVQERLPGVALAVAWQYLTQSQKQSFKEQTRVLLQQLQSIKPDEDVKYPTYLIPDPDPIRHRGIQELERDIIFGSEYNRTDLAFAHNDVQSSNLIVNNDRIVGLVDWEMAGYFGWKTAEAVHVQIRCPSRDNFTALNLPQEELDDILFWNDLYTINAK